MFCSKSSSVVQMLSVSKHEENRSHGEGRGLSSLQGLCRALCKCSSHHVSLLPMAPGGRKSPQQCVCPVGVVTVVSVDAEMLQPCLFPATFQSLCFRQMPLRHLINPVSLLARESLQNVLTVFPPSQMQPVVIICQHFFLELPELSLCLSDSGCSAAILLQNNVR